MGCIIVHVGHFQKCSGSLGLGASAGSGCAADMEASICLPMLLSDSPCRTTLNPSTLGFMPSSFREELFQRVALWLGPRGSTTASYAGCLLLLITTERTQQARDRHAKVGWLARRLLCGNLLDEVALMRAWLLLSILVEAGPVLLFGC